MHFEALSTKYVNFNHFGWFFENFVTKFLFFWQFFLSFLVWEIILLSKNLSILGILHLSYTQREIKKSFFKQVQLASLQVELGKANSNKASFRQIDLNLRATLVQSAVLTEENSSFELPWSWCAMETPMAPRIIIVSQSMKNEDAHFYKVDVFLYGCATICVEAYPICRLF